MDTFDIERFRSDPSAEQINSCRKEDLFAIAASFELKVARSMRKAELRKAVVEMLVENGVLDTGDGANAAPSLSSSSPVEPDKEEVKATPRPLSAPWSCLLVAVGDQAYHCCVVSTLDDGVGAVSGQGLAITKRGLSQAI